MYFQTPLPVPFLKQLSARFLHRWEAARPCCCMPDIRHRSYLGRWGVFPKIEWVASSMIGQWIYVFFRRRHPKLRNRPTILGSRRGHARTLTRTWYSILLIFQASNDLQVFKWSIVLPPQIFLFLKPPPVLEFPILVNLYLSPKQQLILTHFLLVLLDCGTVYQQIMYITTLLDNLKSVFKILSYALKLLHLS